MAPPTAMRISHGWNAIAPCRITRAPDTGSVDAMPLVALELPGADVRGQPLLAECRRTRASAVGGPMRTAGLGRRIRDQESPQSTADSTGRCNTLITA